MARACPTLRKQKHHIYGEVNSASDIRAINCHIREQIRRAKRKDRITELVRRSLYLYTLTFSPPWRKKFAGKIRQLRKVAKEEYSKTARAANRRLKQLGFAARFDERIG